ncbi:MAG: hypothetical protein ACR2HG_16005 [Pyrinomonadaceae bacterium]
MTNQSQIANLKSKIKITPKVLSLARHKIFTPKANGAKCVGVK